MGPGFAVTAPGHGDARGERRYGDGDRVRHAAFSDGTVVSSKLTRDEEELTSHFPERGVKKLVASLANLEILGWQRSFGPARRLRIGAASTLRARADGGR